MGSCVWGRGEWLRNWQASLRVIGAWDGYGCVLVCSLGLTHSLGKSVLLSLAQGVLGAKERRLGGHPLHYGDFIPSVFSFILYLLSLF